MKQANTCLLTRHKVSLLLVLVIFLGLALRLYQIDRESFWLDEAFSYWAANNSPENIIPSVGDDHPPLYYLILHYWIKFFGDSDKAIRLLSAIFGVLAIPITFQIGKILFNEYFGLVAALFLAVSSFHIYYSQEARFYSLYFLLTSISVLFALLIFKGSRQASIGYVISTILLLYTHNTAIVTVIAITLFYLSVSWPLKLSNISHFIIATLVVVAFYAPYVPVYVSQAIGVKEQFWTSGLTIRNIFSSIQKLVLFPEKISSVGPIQYGLILLPFSIMFLSFLALWDKYRQKLIAIAFLFLFPVASNMIFSMTIRNIFIPRVLIPSLLPLLLFWAMPILIKKRSEIYSYRKLALMASASMFLTSSVASINLLCCSSKEPWRQAAEIFQENYKEGDGMVFLFSYNELALFRYLPDIFYDLPIVGIPEDYRFRFGPKFGPRGTQPLDDKPKVEAGTGALQGLNPQPNRLWLVIRQDATLADPRNKILSDMTKEWLDGHYIKLKEWEFRELIKMILYNTFAKNGEVR